MRLQFASEEALIKFIIGAKLPEWQRTLFHRFAEAVQVHSQGEIFFKIDRLFPNENPASKEHRIMSFESVTEPSFGRAANNVNRIFKNSSYTVEASDKTIEVTTADTYCGQNFYNWFLDEWIRWALKEDPNSRFIIYPPEYVNDDPEKERPICAFIESKFIKFMDSENFLCISESESDVVYQLEELYMREVFFDQSIDRLNILQQRKHTFTPKIVAKIVRPVYHLFIKGDGFYRIEQEKERGNSYLVEYYPIDKDFLPVEVAGGEKGKREVYKSFLHPFVQFGNLALLQHSQHTAVNFTFSFPRMSEIETPCDAPGCTDGRIECDISDKWPEGLKPCRACMGTGYRASQSPYRVYKKKFDPNAVDWEVQKAQLEVPTVQFYTPDTSILEYSKKEWKEYLEMAETAVYIQQRVKTGNVEAAKSKEIDREDLYSFLARVGQTFFSKLRFAVQCLENYYIANPIKITVVTPYSYAIVSEGEAFVELQNILQANVPIMLKASRIESFINKFVSQSSPIRKFLDVLKLVDPLLYYSPNELTAYKVGGVISTESLVVHVYAYSALQKLYSQDKALFMEDAQIIADKLTVELKKFEPQANPNDLKMQLLLQQQQSQQQANEKLTPPITG